MSAFKSVVPRIWQIAMEGHTETPPSKWGWYRYDELLDCVNNTKAPIGPWPAEELWDRFFPLSKGFYNEVPFGPLKQAMVWILDKEGGHQRAQIEAICKPNFKGQPASLIFVPVKWGQRVLRAVRDGFVEARVEIVEGTLRKPRKVYWVRTEFKEECQFKE